MARTHDKTTSWNLTDDATFRTWASAVHNALSAAGLVQTADTGQINLATVARPGAADTEAGFEIWRFDDAEQAVNPIYLRIGYVSGDAVTQGRLNFQAGKGSNGSGTLTSPSGAVSSTSADATDAAGRVIHCGHVDGSLLLFATADIAQTSGAQFWVAIDREMNAAGAYTGQLFFAGMAGGSFATQVWNGSAWATVVVAYGNPGFSVDPSGNVPVGTLWPAGFRAPLRSILTGPDSSFGAEDQGTIEIDGVARDYMALTGVVGFLGGINSGPSTFFSSGQQVLKAIVLDE